MGIALSGHRHRGRAARPGDNLTPYPASRQPSVHPALWYSPASPSFTSGLLEFAVGEEKVH